MELQKLNLPQFSFIFRYKSGKPYIFDRIRKKFVSLTPEEWVRQNFIHFLTEIKNYPETLMAVEKQIIVNGLQFRTDLVVYSRKGKPKLVAEFKAPDVKISQEVFDQVVRYNMALSVEMVVVSNGLKHYSCLIDYNAKSYSYMPDIPDFD
jgi:hypothetical protein